MNDPIKRPAYYTRYPVEVIEITRELPFPLGNVVKYVLRAPYKGGVEDCDKALMYLAWCSGPVFMPLVKANAWIDAVRTLAKALHDDGKHIQGNFLGMVEICAGKGNYSVLRVYIEELQKELQCSK